MTPYCPRCETSLSDHELAQGYETVVDPRSTCACHCLGGPLADLGAALLVWTTTPWTLVSNTAVAVHPDVTYVAATDRSPNEVLVVAEPLFDSVLGATGTVVTVVAGVDLERLRYQRPFDLVEIPGAHIVVLADYVTTEQRHRPGPPGASLRCRGPRRSARPYGLPVVNPIRADGRFEDGRRLVGGQFFKKADATLVEDLDARGAAVPAPRVRARLPALLALPHPAALLRAAVLVHPHHRRQGRAAAGERAHHLVSRDDQVGALRRLAAQQRRLGAVTQPVLGHPAAVWRCDRGHVTRASARGPSCRGTPAAT